MMRAAATLLVCAAAHGDLTGSRDPSPAIFPEQRIPLTFSHEQHLAKKLKCDFCHSKAPGSRVARDFLIPSESACLDCHEIERDKPDKQAKPGAACAGCHPGWNGAGQPPRVDVPAPWIKFNHEVHVARGVECVRCHATVPGVALATRADLPRMPLCLECHDGRQAPSRCTTCHVSEADGRIRTDLPTGVLEPSGVLRGDAHDLAFRRDHRRAAANDERYCENCHRPEWCLGCHNGVMKPLDIHGNDYLTLHAADARRNVPDCSSCHRVQTFCLGCHQRSGVALARDGQALPGATRMPSEPYNPFFTGGRRFHPPGWVATPRASDHHSFQAQRNVGACASCHREETCLGCHATAAVRMGAAGNNNPHPSGWADSSRCRALASKNPRMCLKCHALDDPLRECE